VKSVLKSAHKHRRYLHFCDRHVCSIQYAVTLRLQLRAWPILCTGLCPAQLFLVLLSLSSNVRHLAKAAPLIRGCVCMHVCSCFSCRARGVVQTNHVGGAPVPSLLFHSPLSFPSSPFPPFPSLPLEVGPLIAARGSPGRRTVFGEFQTKNLTSSSNDLQELFRK